MEVVKERIGRQDQYAAAFGGLNLLRFGRGGRVMVEPQPVRNGSPAYLFSNIMMFWTDHQRPAPFVLTEQRSNTSRTLPWWRLGTSYTARGCCTRPGEAGLGGSDDF